MNLVWACVGLWFALAAMAVFNHWRDGVYD